MMQYNFMHGGFMHFGIAGIIINVLIFLFISGLIVLGIIALIRFIGTNNAIKTTSSKAEETALDILKNRLAKGEITPEQFDELKARIQ
jgi:putative membrane protein